MHTHPGREKVLHSQKGGPGGSVGNRKVYMWGRHFTFRTDRSPLITLLASKGQAVQVCGLPGGHVDCYHSNMTFSTNQLERMQLLTVWTPLPSPEPSLDDDRYTLLSLTLTLTLKLHVLYRLSNVNCSHQHVKNQLKACCQSCSHFSKSGTKSLYKMTLWSAASTGLPDSFQPKLREVNL